MLSTGRIFTEKKDMKSSVLHTDPATKNSHSFPFLETKYFMRMDENCDFVKRKHLVLSGTLKKTNAKYFMRIEKT